jgi:hypothetical protein
VTPGDNDGRTRPPDKVTAQDITVASDSPPTLDSSAGAVLVPFWVCEYTLNGEHFRAFVNGASGTVAGPPHVDTVNTQALGALIGAPVSALCAWAVLGMLFHSMGRSPPLLFRLDEQELAAVMWGVEIDGIPVPGAVHVAALAGAAFGCIQMRQLAQSKNAEFERMGQQVRPSVRQAGHAEQTAAALPHFALRTITTHWL